MGTLDCYSSIPSTVVSRLPFIGTIRRVKHAVSRSRTLPTIPDASACLTTFRKAKNPPTVRPETPENTTTTILSRSGSSTPTSRPGTPEELSMTKLEIALRHPASEQHHMSGIDWEAASIGNSMLVTAFNRSSSTDTAMSRNMYIDALKYLHSSLPDDLSESEVQALCEFLPDQCLQHAADRLASQIHNTGRQTRSGTPSVVRSGTAGLVSLLIALFMLVVPIFASLLKRGLEYEREHHLAERALSTTGQLAKSASSAGMSMSDHVLRLSRSPAGAFCVLKLGWLVQNVAEGVNDGLSQSLSVPAEDRNRPMRALVAS